MGWQPPQRKRTLHHCWMRDCLQCESKDGSFTLWCWHAMDGLRWTMIVGARLNATAVVVPLGERACPVRTAWVPSDLSAEGGTQRCRTKLHLEHPPGRLGDRLGRSINRVAIAANAGVGYFRRNTERQFEKFDSHYRRNAAQVIFATRIRPKISQ